MAKNLGRAHIGEYVITEIESLLSSQITRFSIPLKFKQPHLYSYNGSESLVDHVRTYKAKMALTINANELLCLVFPGSVNGLAAQ